ncbi:MAG: tetratricopeptide repeat protein [Rhodospirillaceae bacterium]|nr:tetratricopeptide repeat protein [Rhodospirillaceae bacterium]
MFRDALGLEVTAASQAAVDAFDKTITAYLDFANDTGARLKEALTLDPAFVLAHCFKGYLFHLMGAKALVPRAVKELELAQAGAAHITAREQCHVRALAAWCQLDLQGATAAWEAAIRDNPRDLLAVKMLHFTHFYMGDSQSLRDSVGRVWPAWHEAMPGYGYMLSMRAFGLEETGAYDEALRLGLRAYEINPNDAWAVHAVAHVHDMRDQRVEGLAWLDQTVVSGGTQWHNFRYHLLWHKALVLHEMERYGDVLALYDSAIWDAKSDEYLDLANNTSLLLRLEMAGIGAGERWQALAAKVQGRKDEHLLAFVDTHFMMPLGVAAPDHAAQFLESIDAYMDGADDTYASVAKAVSRDLCAAVRAYQAGHHDACVELLEPVRALVHLIGGSHAQRDVFTEILIEAAIKAGRHTLARSLLYERVSARPKNARAWKRLAYVLRQLGDVDAAMSAMRHAAP